MKAVNYRLVLDICLTLRHPLLAVLPQLADARDSDEVAGILVDNYEAVERWALALSA